MEGLICAYICKSRQHGMSHSAVHDATGDRAPQSFPPHSAHIQCRCAADPWAATPQKTHPSCTYKTEEILVIVVGRGGMCLRDAAMGTISQSAQWGGVSQGSVRSNSHATASDTSGSTSFPTGTSTMTPTDNTPKSVHQSFQGSCTHLRISNSTLKTSPRPFTSPTKCMNG